MKAQLPVINWSKYWLLNSERIFI